VSILASIAARAGAVIIPTWAKWAAFLVLLTAVYGTGRLHEARRGADAHADYVAKQAAQTVVIIKKQVEVVTKIETKYVNRIQKIYAQGAAIETNIPTYIQPVDLDRFAVNVGFLRVLDAAWSGDAPGPAEELDREPAGVPLDQVAAVQVGNATSCRAWREQALGWREFYAGQQVVINGGAGEWARTFRRSP
jgi:hypothetical protein